NREWPRRREREGARSHGERGRRQQRRPLERREEVRRDPAALQEPERPRRRRPGHVQREVGPGSRQKKVSGGGKNGGGREQASRKRRGEASAGPEPGEEEDRQEVPVAERPASVPVRIGGQQQKESEDGGKREDAIRAVFARSPPGKETRYRPDQE